MVPQLPASADSKSVPNLEMTNLASATGFGVNRSLKA